MSLTTATGTTHGSEAALQRILLNGLRENGSGGESPSCSDHGRLWSALTVAADGGKRLRPALVTTVHDALGGTDDGAAAVVGAALELLHTAFVVHDDVIDGDDTRRGRPNVTGRFAADARAQGADPVAARSYGEAAGILAGDLALAGAVMAVATSPTSPERVRRLLDLVDRALSITAAGELSDVRLGLGLAPASLAEVLTTAERKTAVYSFQLPMQAGAVLAGAGEPVIERLGEAGRLVGIAFQLLDDVQGVFGKPAETGKSALSDLREGKQTALIAHARSTAAWPQISAQLSGPPLTEERAATVRRLLLECGSRRFVEDLAGDYVQTALAVLDDAQLPVALVAVLTAMVTTMTDDVTGRAA